MRYKFCDFVVALAILALATGPLQGGDWPTYRADAARTGYSSEPLGDDLELRWIYRNRTAPAPAWPDSSRITFDFAYQPIIAGSTHLLVFRSATLGYLDLTRDAGTENFGGIRPGCWFNAIVAGGMVLVPDGSSKCACSYQMRSWLALQRQQ